VSAETTTGEPRTYGNWRRPGGGGLFGLGKFATYGGIAYVVFGLILMIFVGPLLGFIVLAIGITAIAAASIPLLHGRTLLQGIIPRVAHTRDRALGRTRHRAGPLTTDGTYRLPGLAAKTKLGEGVDSQGRAFAYVTVPKRQHHTIVFQAEPDGDALVDESDVEIWVARWGLWLASLGDEPGILAASVTIETSPDSGERLKRELDRTTSPDAPRVALAMLEEIRETSSAGSAQVKAMVTVTLRGTKGQYREDLERDLAGRVVNLGQGLIGTGAGAARPMSAADLCEMVRCAYDPDAQERFADARMAGEPVALSWGEIGPVAHDADYGVYRHDGCASVTWSMTVAPRGNVVAEVLERLLKPHPDVDRKRVTLLYRPLASGKAARVVDSDRRDAEATVRNAKQPTARQEAERDVAKSNANEEAHGAGLTNFALVVTATVTDPERLPAAKSAVSTLGPTARLQLRPMYGMQQEAFIAALPIGVVLPAHKRATRAKEGI
jgi:hypothetical protein